MIKKLALIFLLVVSGADARNKCTCGVTHIPYGYEFDKIPLDHCARELCKCVCRVKTKFPVDCTPKNGAHCHCAAKGSENHG